MAEPHEPDVRRRRRRLDARTVGICVCIALIGAIAAYLIAAAVMDDGNTSAGHGTSDPIKLSSGKVDGGELITTKIVRVDGTATTLRAVMTDKPALVNLWSQSCVPCVDEMPLLQRLHASDQRVAVIGVAFQDKVGPARTMARKTGIHYPWYRDPTGIFGAAAQTTYIPRSVLVTPDGKVLGVKTGQFHSLAEVRKWLDERLS